MAIACPACGRPNAESATRCVYCTESIESMIPPTAEGENDASSSSSGWYLMILAPQGETTTEANSRIERFAEIVGMSIYDSRLALQATRPRLLRKVPSRADADAISGRLSEVGIAHHQIAESAIDAIPIVPVRRLDFTGHGLVIETSAGERRVCDYADLSLLIRGEIVRARHLERRMATREGASRPITGGLRLHLYARSQEAAVELDPEQFDWEVLGQRRSASTLLNFQALIGEILRRAPHVVLDRGFDLEPDVLSRTDDGVEMGALMSVEGSASEATVYDNQAQFRYYSRWRYLVSEAEAAGPSPE